VQAIFEASFQSDDLYLRTDILKRDDGGSWKLIEVKFSTNLKEEHLYDVWFQWHVLRKLGFDISSASLMHLNKIYIYNGNEIILKDLFAYDELADKIEQMDSVLKIELDNLREVVSSENSPDISPSRNCNGCEFFNHCTNDKPEHWIYYLPRISEKKWRQLTGVDIEDISDIPDDFDLTSTQLKVRDCVKEKKESIDVNLLDSLNSLKFPLYFLDFETINPAIPIYENTKPYSQIAFQWSCHVLTEDGNLEHHEYLHNDDSDPRKPFTESLIECLKQDGDIVHYHSFEKTQLKALIEAFPEYKSDLERVIDRLCDILQIIRKYYYHPDFKGSYSIKNVLPVLVPEMSYENLEIQHGGMASIEYLRMINPKTSPDEKNNIRKSLLEYCGQDTMAMVKIYNVLKSKIL